MRGPAGMDCLNGVSEGGWNLSVEEFIQHSQWGKRFSSWQLCPLVPAYAAVSSNAKNRGDSAKCPAYTF